MRMGDCCLNTSEEICIYIMARTSYISLRRWWYSPCSRPTRLLGFVQYYIMSLLFFL